VKTPFAILVFLAVIASVSTDVSAQGARQRTYEEIVAMPVVYSVPRMAEVKVMANLRYATANDPNLLMDVYLPPGLKAGQRRPVVMFIHGGAGSESRPKDWGFYKSWGRLAAASGFVAVTFTHRLGYPDPLLAESAQDVGQAIDYVRTHAGKLSADPERIALAAYSAGGPMLALGLEQKRPYVRCLLAFYAFLDIQQSDLHRQHEPAERVRQYAMIERLGEPRARAIPMFIGRGSLDEIPTMNDSIDRFVARALRENANVTVMNHPTGGHTFDSQNDDDRSREIIQSAITFLERHLR
jgi:acetyl esterase/lipase